MVFSEDLVIIRKIYNKKSTRRRSLNKSEKNTKSSVSSDIYNKLKFENEGLVTLLHLLLFTSHLSLSRPRLCVSGGLWAGVSDGEEGGGAGGADGLVEDDVRDTELLKRLSGWWWSECPHIDVIYSTFCVPVHSKKKEYIVSYLFCSLSIIILIDYIVY